MQLRELLHAGLRLPVGVPEVEELRQDIRRREWLEAAKKVQSSKGTLHTLTELLNSAPDMGAEDTALAQQIQSKVAAARTWDERAVAFLARYEVAGGLPEDSRPAVEELSELVTEGQATGVKMERLTYLSNQMNAASKWLAKAATCFSAKPAVAEDAAAQQSPDVNGAEPMELENGAPNGHGAAESSDHKPAEGHVPQASKPEGPAPKYDLIVALVQEYERNLMVFCKEVEGLRELQKAADAWLETARPVLEQEFVVDEQLPQLRELIASGKATGVHMEQVDILEANVEALLWAQQVRELLQKLPEKLTTDPLPETNPAGDDQAAAPTSAPEPPAANGGPDAPSQLVDEAARQPEGEGHEDELARAAAAAHPGLCFGIPPPDPDPSDTEDDAPPITTPYDQRPALPALVALLEEGSILPCDEELFLRFKGCVETAQEWERQARAALAVNKEGGPASLVDVRAMRRLVAQGERLGMAVPALPRLHDVLRAHGKWEQRVRDLMATAGARPAFAELQVFQQTARLSPVNSNLRRHIDAAVDAVEDWKERCRRLVAKRNTGMRLERCFEVLGYSVDCAVEQFERRLEVEKQLVATGPQRKVPGGEGEDERELYCLCQQPYNVDTAMISCDLCGEWYHMRCVGMSQAQARSLRKYTCPICAAVRVSETD